MTNAERSLALLDSLMLLLLPSQPIPISGMKHLAPRPINDHLQRCRRDSLIHIHGRRPAGLLLLSCFPPLFFSSFLHHLPTLSLADMRTYNIPLLLATASIAAAMRIAPEFRPSLSDLVKRQRECRLPATCATSSSLYSRCSVPQLPRRRPVPVLLASTLTVRSSSLPRRHAETEAHPLLHTHRQDQIMP